jgi:DNA repair protein RadC
MTVRFLPQLNMAEKMEAEDDIRLAKHQILLKEKFAKVGLEDFFDREVLELLFSYSRPGKRNDGLIESLLEQYGNFKNIIDASLKELIAHPGMDGHTAILLRLLKEGSEFYLKNKIMKQKSRMCWSDIISYCRASMEGLKEEHFKVIFLDKRNSVCGIETLYEGTIDRAIIYPRTVIKRALSNNAKGLILVHNHPSGDPTPSMQDMAITQVLFKVAKGIDIEIQDHLIIGSSKYYSFKDSGLLLHME